MNMGYGLRIGLLFFVSALFLFLPWQLAGASPVFQWHTFLGSGNDDYGKDLAVDVSGNIYVTGYSGITYDVFVAKLNSSGNVQWSTFLGSASTDFGYGIAVDGNGNIYVTGKSQYAWDTGIFGTPVNPHSGGVNYDVVAAKLNNSGSLQWYTFLGVGTYDDSGEDIALDSSGNIYLTGDSGLGDAFVAKLNNSGALQWATGTLVAGGGRGIAVDASGNVYAAGYSGNWGMPVNPYAGGDDVFVAKLTSGGGVQWNTFLGSAYEDYGYGIALDSTNNIYVTGSSESTWGAPVNPYENGMTNAFAAKLNNSGVLQWNTFQGMREQDYNDSGNAIAIDNGDNLYITGTHDSTLAAWDQAFFLSLNGSTGVLQDSTFLGASGNNDGGEGVVVYGNGSIYLTGVSWGPWDSGWGMPVNPYAGSLDAFVAAFATDASYLLWTK